MVRRVDEVRRAEWQDRFCRFRSSGLSVQQFCAEERQLVGVAVTTRVGFEPRQVVTRFEVNDPLDWFEPVDPNLAGEPAVLGPHDTLGDSVLQQIDSRLVHRDRFVHPLDHFELRIRENRFTNRRCPFSPGFRRSTEWLENEGSTLT